MAAYDVSTCDINKYFKDNQLVLTVNLCGKPPFPCSSYRQST